MERETQTQAQTETRTKTQTLDTNTDTGTDTDKDKGTSGTIWNHKSWSCFSWLLGKTRPGPKAKHLKRHTRKRKLAVGTQKVGWCAPGGSLHTKSLETRLLSHFFPVQVLFQVSALFRRTLSERLGALFQVESAPLFKYICMYRYMYIHT